MKLAMDVWYEDWKRSEGQRGAGGDTDELHNTVSVLRVEDDRLAQASKNEFPEREQVDCPDRKSVV